MHEMVLSFQIQWPIFTLSFCFQASSDVQGDGDTTEPKVHPEKLDVTQKDENSSNSLIKK